MLEVRTEQRHSAHSTAPFLRPLNISQPPQPTLLTPTFCKRLGATIRRTDVLRLCFMLKIFSFQRGGCFFIALFTLCIPRGGTIFQRKTIYARFTTTRKSGEKNTCCRHVFSFVGNTHIRGNHITYYYLFKIIYRVKLKPFVFRRKPKLTIVKTFFIFPTIWPEMALKT